MSSRTTHDQGYTLAEMLTVLALLAIIASVSLPASLHGRGSHQLESHARTIVAMLRAARLGAISGNIETRFEADLVNRSLSAPRTGERLQLAHNIGLSLLTARNEVQHGVGAIRFYPDGTSSGGTVRLALGKRTVDVRVDWLTGRVSRHDAH